MPNGTRVFNSNKNSNNFEKEKNFWNKSNSFQMNCIPMRIGKGKRFNKNKIFEEFYTSFESPYEYYEI